MPKYWVLKKYDAEMRYDFFKFYLFKDKIVRSKSNLYKYTFHAIELYHLSTHEIK